jgi:hypothetical protein
MAERGKGRGHKLYYFYLKPYWSYLTISRKSEHYSISHSAPHNSCPCSVRLVSIISASLRLETAQPSSLREGRYSFQKLLHRRQERLCQYLVVGSGDDENESLVGHW